MARTRKLWIAASTLFFWAAPALAGHHQWDFTEFFSNADGTVQFFEMIGTANNEQNLNGFTVTSNSQTFTFVGNLPSTATNGKWVLVATQAFADLPGAPTPDYIIPADKVPFFNTAGDTLTYDTNKDVVTFGAVPTDGVTSIDDVGGTATNSPTNFVGTMGSVDASGTGLPALGALAAALLIGAVLLVGARRLEQRPA